MGALPIKDFEVPDLCGANPNFNAFAKKIDDIKSQLKLDIEADIPDLKAKLTEGFSDLQDKLKSFAPELPSIPDVNLQSQLTQLVNIDVGSLAGKLQFEAKKLDLENKFGDALKSAGTTFGDTLSGVKDALAGGGDVCQACKNLVEGADGTIKEKPNNAVQADKPAEVETKSEVQTNKAVLDTATADLKTALSNGKAILGKILGDAGANLTITPEPGLKITPAIEEVFKKLDARAKIQTAFNGGFVHPGNFLNKLNGISLNSLESAANASGDGLNLSEEEAFRNKNARLIISEHAAATAVVQQLKTMLDASISPSPHNQAPNPNTKEVDGTFIYVKLREKYPIPASEDDHLKSWDGIYQKRKELQSFLDKGKIFNSNTVFTDGLDYDIVPFQADCGNTIIEAKALIKTFNEKFVIFNTRGGDTANV